MAPLLLVIIALACLLPVPSMGQAMRSLTTPNQGSVAMSNVTFTTFRAEFRLENLTTSATRRYVWALGAFPTVYCFVEANGLQLRCENQADGHPQGAVLLNLAGRTDVRVRFQRDTTGQLGKMDIWNGDCTSRTSLVRTIVPSAPYVFNGDFNVGGGGLRIGFLRLYSTLDTTDACPADAPVATGNMVDFRFEGDSLSDVSGRNYTLSITGHSFASSPSYAPLAAVSGWSTYKPVFRTNTPFTLDGGSSVTFSGTGQPDQYRWKQIDGPELSSFIGAAGSTVTIRAPVAGQYVYRLTITDTEGRTSSTDQPVGVVATDARGVVLMPSPEMAAILGPLTPHGSSPWPWYDVAEAAVADTLRTPYTAPLSETIQTGAISVTSSAPNKASGQYVEAGCNPHCSIVAKGTGTNFTQDLVGRIIYLHWDADGDGSFKGRSAQYVSAVDDATTLRFASYYWLPPGNKSLNMTFALAGDDYFGYRAYHQSGNPWNYYEAGLGVYRLYYRTGLTAYRDQARAFCENWFRYALDSGYGTPIPRNSGWHFIMACAADNHPDWWEPIRHLITYGIQNPTSPMQRTVAGWGGADFRELSYMTRATALFARVYPPHSSNPSTSRTTWCGYLQNQVNNIWLHTFAEPGYWEENLHYWSVVYPMAAINGKFGTSPWRVSGLSILALEYAHEALADPNGCNQPALASNVFNVLQTAGDFLWNYGRSPDGGLYYNVLYETFGVTPLAMKSSSAMPPGSSVSVVRNSTTITGSNTTFLTTFAPCDGTTYIGIQANAVPNVENGVYRVASCASNTQLTIAVPYPHTTETVAAYVKTTVATTNCAPSIASHCEADEFSGRNLAADAAAGAAWIFWKTGNATWKDRAEYYAGKVFGGRPGGPGALTGSPVGPYADGGVGNLAEILPSCLSNPPPCGDGALGDKRGKPFGMAAGAGDVPAMLAYRLGGPAPVSEARTVFAGFTMPPNATTARIITTSPSGATEQTTCPSSPCAVSVDPQQGDHLLRIQYESNGGGVVAAGEQQRLAVP